MKNYRHRIADDILKNKLESKGAVLIEGAKWCGKTTTAEQIAKSVIYMQDPSKKAQNIKLAELNPLLLLEGSTPRLIDEWQLAPQLWDALRFEVDRRDEFGQFVLTGSSLPVADMSTSHTGAGRIVRMRMRPMTLFESGESNGKISLAALFHESGKVGARGELNLTDYAFLICRGGWPKTVGLSEKIALRQAIDYVDTIEQSDISRVNGINRNPERVKSLLRSFSRHITSDTKFTNMRADMMANDLDTLSDDTVYSYVNALKLIFVIEDMTAWNPNLRSRTAIRTADTHYFVDPSIAAASLGIGPMDLINDIKTMGLLFECMCIRDLRVFSEVLDGNVYHYRDKTGLECDAVIHLRNGSYALIEVKLGGREIDKASRNLLKLKEKIDTDRMKAPSFMMILTGTEYAYQREDGIYVVPIGCLKD